MMILIRQELFKLFKKHSTWISLIVMMVIQIGFAVMAKIHPDVFNPQETYTTGYYATTLLVFYLIAASSSIITMEFQYGTIKNLLYREYPRGKILISKWITLLVYSVAWLVWINISSLLIKFILFPKVDLGANLGHGYTVLTSTIVVDLANLLTVWLILSIVILLSNLFKNSAAAISVGIISSFVTNIMSGMSALLVIKWPWLKWDPLNMLQYPDQILSPSEIHLTRLTLTQLFSGNLVYIVLLLTAGYFVFQHRAV
ncbi:ABC transporter permease [Lentilactobacillus kefiri]|uniref:ABC superfamily ATP binding cassette transporter, membrane protein n=2 Tax=Lentilactobacillus kefiri TaxID=33962 RepID=A0A8E1V0N5_LENKE|nr:ABC transporter permease [Lentilactobacillus kefiri]KRL73129.1 ABC superfamily ATP binding cassette transporter, membrane protein [Lentilactobacillus parakefiri DSM 10551]KRM52102.1 ABC superfamily ATP binding cassette transporter, membrane protein [Lentilactobacillus kefiri DSM 20587 = JCM 5818]MCJ2162868.1 ABC transporter permease [Lentilactobacillus kefiri]MCP9369816.1 ABC transporter permease [Lentilactobacillus kefiri]MDH5109308.1 ABC transporter permease [Lentilactobacillus kefiri]